MSNNQIKWGVILQYIQMALNILINLIYTPIMINILGNAEYGLYSLATSIISYLSLLPLGFGTSYIRFYSKYKTSNDEEGISSLNGLYILVFSIIGLFALFIGGLISKNADAFLNKSYTAQNIQTAKMLIILLSVNLSISFPASVFVSYISSQERFVFQKLVNMGKTVLNPILSIVFLFLGYGSIGMVIAMSIISLCIDCINAIYAIRYLGMRFMMKFRFELFKEIFAFSIFIAINQVIDQINWQTDKVILGKVVNATSVAVYSVASTINTMFMSFSNAISGVFVARVNMLVSENADNVDDRLTSLFIRVGRLQWFVLALAMSGFVFFGKKFIVLWAGAGYVNAYYVTLLLMFPALVPLIQNIGVEIQRAKNMHQFRSVIYSAMAIINVIISVYFASLWKEIGVAIGTTISILLCNGIILNIYYQKKMNLNVLLFWKSIFKTIPGFIIPIVFGLFILFINIESVLLYLFSIVGYVIVYFCSMYCLGMNAAEKKNVKSVLARLKLIRSCH